MWMPVVPMKAQSSLQLHHALSLLLVTRALGVIKQSGQCTSRFRGPSKPPLHATDYNGIQINDTCFHSRDEHHVFFIGDWGGINSGWGPIPADHTKCSNPFKRRAKNMAVDNNAQWRVAGAFNGRAAWAKPEYVLNVGDNFYWGGVNCNCGQPTWNHCDTGQWKWIYEVVYKGPGVDGKQWLSVLGNHDYGGWQFNKGWDQAIGYTWGGVAGTTGRWMQPALFWAARVHYTTSHKDDSSKKIIVVNSTYNRTEDDPKTFTVDYFMVDTNHNDATNPYWGGEHNICGIHHSPGWGGCGPMGPASIWDCQKWFSDLWGKQMSWLDHKLRASVEDKVDWQMILTHFPPWWSQWDWKFLAWKYGIDLIISGHVHQQTFMAGSSPGNPIAPTAFVVTGGGGGITSEHYPNNWGWDDEYGFVDMTIFMKVLKVEMVSHGSKIRGTSWVEQREAAWNPDNPEQMKKMCKDLREPCPKVHGANSTTDTNGTNPTQEDGSGRASTEDHQLQDITDIIGHSSYGSNSQQPAESDNQTGEDASTTPKHLSVSEDASSNNEHVI